MDLENRTMCLGCAGLGTDSGTADVETLQDFHYMIKGFTYLCTSGNGDVKIDTLEEYTQSANTVCVYLAQINASGTISVLQGTEVATTTYEAGDAVLQWPEPTSGYCAIGGLKLATTAAFTAGTTLLGTGNTPTYYNFGCLPPGPLTYDND